MSTNTEKKPLPRIIWPLIALALVLLFNLFFTPGFGQIEIRDGRLFGSLIDILDRAAPVMLVALGMTLVIATAGIDLSVGAVLAISGAIAAGLVSQPEYSIFANLNLSQSFLLAAFIALLVAALAGAGNGLLVTVAGIQPIVATLILMVAGRGIAQLLTNGQIITFDNPTFAYFGNGTFLTLPISTIVVALAFITLTIIVRKTALGLFIEAVGGNPIASAYVGLRAKLIKIAVYAICGFLAGIAGLLVAADIHAADVNNAGLYIELDAILAVVIGGTALTGGRFSLAGSIIGALLMQSLATTILSRGVPVEYTLVVKGVVVIAVCLLQSPAFRQMILQSTIQRRQRK